jgi:hypothetical protein
MSERSQMTRRQLAARLAGSGLGTAGFVDIAAPAAAARDQDDGAVVRSVLAIELAVVFAYERVLASGTLSSGAESVARQALAHERAHADRLGLALRARGVAPPAPPATLAEADKQLAARHFSGTLAGLRTEAESLRRLYDLESIAIGEYYEALRRLADPRLLKTAAEIMAAEAQHAAAIGGLLHPGNIHRIVPVGFVAGKR